MVESASCMVNLCLHAVAEWSCVASWPVQVGCPTWLPLRAVWSWPCRVREPACSQAAEMGHIGIARGRVAVCMAASCASSHGRPCAVVCACCGAVCACCGAVARMLMVCEGKRMVCRGMPCGRVRERSVRIRMRGVRKAWGVAACACMAERCDCGAEGRRSGLGSRVG